MKKRNNILICSFAVIGVLLMISSSCKKDKDDPAPQAPVFTISAITVQLQAGGEGLQFSAKCTNEDVKMTKVTFTDPLAIQSGTYELNGISIAKNTQFSLQDDNVGYVKESGIWSFTFVGNRASDNQSFSVNSTFSVTAK